MTANLSALASEHRVLFAIDLEPLQGKRFQPTGFPGLGAATYERPGKTSLLVESAQSMANRLELTIWDAAKNDVVNAVKGISHVRVLRKDKRFLTDTVLEAHRLNSPYLLEGSNKTFFKELTGALGALESGPIDRKRLAETLLDYDVGSLLHGVFLAKKELAGGRLRVARALSAFIEAEDVKNVASGGVKNDHVNPSGDTKKGFGNVPFARDEFTAGRIVLYANLDLAQIRGYGLPNAASHLLALLGLLKLRTLVDGDLRLRSACDLRLAEEKAPIVATKPEGFVLPSREELEQALKGPLAECAKAMKVREAEYADDLKKQDEPKPGAAGNADDDQDNSEGEGE